MKKAAQAGLLALAATTLPFGGAAQADDAPVVPASASITSLNWVENADDEARAWRDANAEAYREDPSTPLGIAIAVYYGQSDDMSAEDLQRGLTNVAQRGSVENVEFFFQEQNAPYSGFGLYYDDVVRTGLTRGNVLTELDSATAYVRADTDMFATASLDGIRNDGMR